MGAGRSTCDAIHTPIGLTHARRSFVYYLLLRARVDDYDDDDDVRCNCVICSRYFFFPFHFALTRYVYIAKLHSKRCAITINLINCAERKKDSTRAMCALAIVCVLGRENIHKRATTHNLLKFQFVSHLYLLECSNKSLQISHTQNEKPLVVLFKRYRMRDNSARCVYLFLFFFDLCFFIFKCETTTISILSISLPFVLLAFFVRCIFFVDSPYHLPTIRMCQIYKIRKCI